MIGWARHPLGSGQEESRLQYLKLCTGVWVGKTPPSVVDRRNFVSNISSHALEF